MAFDSATAATPPTTPSGRATLVYSTATVSAAAPTGGTATSAPTVAARISAMLD